jgi:hypothetical protein
MNYRIASLTPIAILLATRFAIVFALQSAPCWAQATIEIGDKLADRQETESGSTGATDMDLFMRIRRDRNNKPVSMETSITRYVTENSEGERVTVDLIGVVHIGEEEYYTRLNEIFEQYDALLYELVAPEGTVIPKGGGEGGGFSPISALQQGMQSVLGLEFQLKHIDYTKNNFVHADMTPDEFAESMKKNDESFFKMALKAVGQGMARQSKSATGESTSDVEMLMAMFSDDRTKIRKVMAEQMLDMESGMVIFQGKDGSTIIDHRNEKAFQILTEQIESGKKHIGVFYGAGHLPDMDERLLKKHGMKRGGQYWLEAWNLNPDE